MNSTGALPILKRFAASEGLFRATSLTANVVMTSLVAQIAGFGQDGVLVSAAVHLSVAGVLEIPTGLLADRFGTRKAMLTGLVLKVVTTACFFMATMMALSAKTAYAVAFLALEAVLDAFANSLLSGAYQASYLAWYRRQLAQVGLCQEDAPPLFLASFRYGLGVRLGVPLVFIAGSAVLMQFGQRSVVGGMILLLPLIGLLGLRVATIARITIDLRPISTADPGVVKIKKHPHALTSLKLCMEVAKSVGRNNFLLNVLGSFLTMTASMFFVGKSMHFLGKVGSDPISSWTNGAGLGLVCYVFVILSGRSLYPALAKRGKNALVYCGLAVIIAGLVLLAVSTLGGSDLLQSLALVASSIVILLAAGGIQKWAESQAPVVVIENAAATWFSLVQTMALTLFALTSGAIICLDLDKISIPFYATAVVMGGLTAAILASRSIKPAITLRRFLTVRIIAATSVLCLAGIVFDARSTYSALTQAANEKEITYANLAAGTLREPLLQGSFVETKRRVASLIKETGALCIGINSEGFPADTCSEMLKYPGRVSYIRDVHFGEQSTSAFATLTLVFDRSTIDVVVRHRVLMTLLGYVIAAAIAVVLLRMMSRRIIDEFEAVQGIASGLLRPEDENRKFRIAEAKSIETSLRKAVQDAVEAQKMAAVLRTSQMLAHDVRKPFSTLRSALFVLRGLSGQPEKYDSMIARLQVELGRSMRHVEAMLADLMQIGAPVRLDKQAVKLRELIDGVVEDVRTSASSAGIQFDVQVMDDIGVFVDVEKISRVLSNIIENAVQAQPGIGRIWIYSRIEEAANLTLIIGNSDSFIPEIEREVLFQPFHTKGKKGGTGLGLAISQRIIEAHGGRIRCESELEGGTQFIMTIPIATDDRGIFPIDVSAKSARILIVEDDEFYGMGLLKILREAFTTDQLEVKIESDSRKALDLVKHEAFELVMCDIDLGHDRPDGWEIAKVVRLKHGAAAQILVHSGRPDGASEAVANGFSSEIFLTKTAEQEEVIRAVREKMRLSTARSHG